MSVTSRTFGTFHDANAFAKSVRGWGRVVLVRDGNGFTVTYDDPTAELEAIRASLEQSTNEIALRDEINFFLTRSKSLSEGSSALNSQDGTLLASLPELLDALEDFIYLLEEANPRSREEALYFAERFSVIADRLGPYKVSGRAQRERRKQLEDAEPLPSSDSDDSRWLRNIASLNANAPTCRLCNHQVRMHIVGRRGAELWRCNENNHGTRFLTRDQRRVLER